MVLHEGWGTVRSSSGPDTSSYLGSVLDSCVPICHTVGRVGTSYIGVSVSVWTGATLKTPPFLLLTSDLSEPRQESTAETRTSGSDVRTTEGTGCRVNHLCRTSSSFSFSSSTQTVRSDRNS